MTDKRIALINPDGTCEVGGVVCKLVPVDIAKPFENARFGFIRKDGSFEELIGEGWEARCRKECINPRWVGGAHAAQDIQAAMLSAAALDLSSLPRVPPDPEIDKRIFDNEAHKFAWVDGWLSALIALRIK